MIALGQIKDIARPTPSKIVLLVIDGLGGLPHPKTGMTELETAKTPNLDRLAKEGICGIMDPVSPGIIPGSAPGHLALFGYDPLRFVVGRGVLEALGIDFELKERDVAARGNFCTVDGRGLITDRRAGRISSQRCTELCGLLSGLNIKNTRLFVSPVKEHRFVVVFRGEGLSSELSDSDPQKEGLAPKSVIALSPEAARAASIANEFIAKAKAALADQYPTNMVLLRGFAHYPDFPKMSEVFGLKPAAIASYPMYRGLAKVVGMEPLATGATIEEEFFALVDHYNSYDYFFLHVKEADIAGEDGDFDRKVRVIEEVDRALPRLIALDPDVIIVTADHSTPAVLKGHSWHPVPFLLRSQWCRPDGVEEFSERSCSLGALGRFPATDVMPLALANALKLGKFGA
ncbi:MAG: 2,3-bisphosphoglycerate-independent phosphoglycerate mutase [Dehalococcoidia bacterium]|nr:MAG: 2,3-bisphosphoglycerate-independent phosphoglycerate mutase [Dehalococcoidia bacterium]